MNAGVDSIKETMGRYEERTNDDKEERIILGEASADETRMLGTVAW